MRAMIVNIMTLKFNDKKWFCAHIINNLYICIMKILTTLLFLAFGVCSYAQVNAYSKPTPLVRRNRPPVQYNRAPSYSEQLKSFEAGYAQGYIAGWKEIFGQYATNPIVPRPSVQERGVGGQLTYQLGFTRGVSAGMYKARKVKNNNFN